MNQLREFRKKVAAAKNEKNTEIAQKRMNQVIAKGGTANRFTFGNNTQRQPVQTREQVTFRGFAGSEIGRTGLDNTTIATGTRRSKVEKPGNRRSKTEQILKRL